MFRFFRTIRKRLLGDRNIGRYLLYAVGEILLVVIGILIALQVDNWNEERQERKEAIRFYQNTRQQLLEDRRDIEGQIMYNNMHRESFEYGIALIENDDRGQLDSLVNIAGNLMDYSDFDRTGNIYETVVNSGDVRLIRNEEINNRLRRLEETYLYVNRMETIHYDVIMQMAPTMATTINFAARKVADEDALYSVQFQNLFALALRIIGEKDMVYHRALYEIDGIIQLMEEVIETENNE